MTELAKALQYEGNEVRINEKGYWNAVDMSTPFGKHPKDWMRTDSAKRFIEAQSGRLKCQASDLVDVTNGNNGGTWIHEKLVIKLAQWLSVDFEIWCSEQIETLMREGSVSINSKELPQTYIAALEALVESEKEKERLLIENKKQSNEIVEMAVQVSEMKEKVSYVDTILSSKKTITMTQLSQDYGLSAVAMNKKLESLAIQRKVGGQWVLYASYLPCGYVQSKTVNITRSSGQPDIVLNTEWTQKGRLFLYHKLKDNGIVPTIEK